MWPEWDRWVRSLSNNEEVAARVPGASKLAVIEAAPGTYVKAKLGEPTPVLPETKLPEIPAAIEAVAEVAPEAPAAEATPATETAPVVETPAAPAQGEPTGKKSNRKSGKSRR